MKQFTEWKAKYHLSPSDIELELTETTIMINPKQAESILGELNNLGFVISLDDFGKGYSSLSLLSHLRVSILKIDEQFISNLTQEKNESIVRSVLSLSQSLSLDVIAEGVETEQQLEYLQKHRCHAAQGFYLCKPCSPDEFEARLKKKTD